MDSLGAQHAPDLMFGYIPQSVRQQRSGPAPLAGWRRLVQLVQNAAPGVFVVAGRSSWPRGILEPGQTRLGKTYSYSPLADGCGPSALRTGDGNRALTVGGGQNHAGSLGQTALGLARANPTLQRGAVFWRQGEGGGVFAHAPS